MIVPAFNEKNNLLKVVKEVQSKAPFCDIVVINDCSTDNTLELCLKNEMNVISTIYNMGIGGAMQTGYKYALENNYDIAIQVDGDGQHPADEIDSLIKPLTTDAVDVVIGSRYLQPTGYESTFSRLVGTKLFSLITSFLIKTKITDVTSGFRAVNSKVIKFFVQKYPEDFPDAETIILLSFVGFKLKEIPVRMHKRMSGESSITYMKSVVYFFKTSISILAVLLQNMLERK